MKKNIIKSFTAPTVFSICVLIDDYCDLNNLNVLNVSITTNQHKSIEAIAVLERDKKK